MSQSIESGHGLRWWQSAAARDVFCFGALAAVLLVLLHQSLFEGKGLVAADAVLNWPPWNQATRPSNIVLADQYRTFLPTQEFDYQQGPLPLWNPDLCCGVPNLGAIQGALLFPIRLLFSPLDPFAASGPSAFLKLCLAGWFTMMYLRLLGVSRPAAWLAGMVFSMSGFMIVWLGHPHVNSAMWLPLLLYAVEKSFRAGRGNALTAPAIRAWVIFAIAFACMILGGHPPTAIQVTVAVAVYFLYRLVEHRHDQALLRTVLLACSIIAGVLLAAPQILPYLEYYFQSSSVESSASLARWSMHLTPASLIRFLLPNVLGNPARGFTDLPSLLGWREADHFEVDNFSERTGYVGILPLFLAFCAISLRRCRFTRFYACLAGGCMLVVFGAPPFAAIAHALPILRYVNETRLLLIIGFSVAVLAGLGWDELSRSQTPRPKLVTVAVFIAIVGIPVLCFWLGTAPNYHNLDPSHLAFFRTQWLILAAGIIAALFLAVRSNGWVPLVVCVVWSAADLLWFAVDYNPSISRDHYYPRTPAIEWLQTDQSLFRIFGGGNMLGPDCAEVFGLNDARGCDYMTVRRYEELITGRAGDFFFYRNAADFPKAFPLLNVKYILAPKALPLNQQFFEPVYSGEIFIYRFKACRDRALLVYDYQVEPDRAAVLARVSSGGFDPQKTVLLEAQPTPIVDISSTQTNQPGSVRIVSYEPDRVRLEAALTRPGFLLLLDTYFPGWSATVNGSPVTICRADYNFRAVPLPAGTSTVVFSYFPGSLRWGMILCGAGVLALAAAWFAPRKAP